MLPIESDVFRDVEGFKLRGVSDVLDAMRVQRVRARLPAPMRGLSPFSVEIAFALPVLMQPVWVMPGNASNDAVVVNALAQRAWSCSIGLVLGITTNGQHGADGCL